MTSAVIFDMYETLITHYKSPLYFSEDMARDAGIEWEKFYATWHGTDKDRTLGKMTFQQVIRKILEENHAWDQQKFDLIVKKRSDTKWELFNHLHPQIIPMLEALKSRGIKIALISNCFDEEAEVIRHSVLAPYFDTTCLSCELGVAKPEPGIFNKCLEGLGLSAGECIYCGDGGSNELEAASTLGMRTFQACWYFSPDNQGILTRKNEFTQLETPMDLLNNVQDAEQELDFSDLSPIQQEIAKALVALGEKARYSEAILAKKIRDNSKIDGKKKAGIGLLDLEKAIQSITDQTGDCYALMLNSANDLLIEKSSASKPLDPQVHARRLKSEKSMSIFTNADLNSRKSDKKKEKRSDRKKMNVNRYYDDFED